VRKLAAEVWWGKDGWYSRIKSGNGRELFRQSEAVRSKRHCLKMLDRLSLGVVAKVLTALVLMAIVAGCTGMAVERVGGNLMRVDRMELNVQLPPGQAAADLKLVNIAVEQYAAEYQAHQGKTVSPDTTATVPLTP